MTRDVPAGGAGFTSQWDALFVHTVRNSLIATDHGFTGGALRRVVYTESHDEVANGHDRLPKEISPGNGGGYYARKRSILGAVLVFTSPGVPTSAATRPTVPSRRANRVTGCRAGCACRSRPSRR